MTSQTTRFGERNLARPGLRRTATNECRKATILDRDNLTKPAMRTRSTTFANMGFDSQKVGALKPSNIRTTKPLAEKVKVAEISKFKEAKPAVASKVIDDLATKMNDISVEDIDADDRKNPLLCSEYINEIYAHMKFMEQELAVDADYMSKKVDITERMRGILIDWLIQVHLKFKLLPETLYLTVAILDRFLSKTDIKRDRLQLVGVTSMLIASKFEEIYAPEVNDFVFITDRAYTFQEILDMEITILNTLHFDLNHPLPLHFLRRNSKAGNADGKVHTLGKYLLEISLPSIMMLKFKPSEVAAGAFLVAQHVLMPDRSWDKTLTHYTGYSREDALAPAKCIAELVIRAEKSKQQAVRNKYGSSKFMSVSRLEELDRVHDFLSQ